MKRGVLAVALALLLVESSRPVWADRLADPLPAICLGTAPGAGITRAEACQRTFLFYYVLPQVRRELERARIGPVVPPCWRGPCPDPAPDFQDRFQTELKEIRAKFGDPSPEPNIIARESQLAAAQAMKAALTRSMKAIEAE